MVSGEVLTIALFNSDGELLSERIIDSTENRVIPFTAATGDKLNIDVIGFRSERKRLPQISVGGRYKSGAMMGSDSVELGRNENSVQIIGSFNNLLVLAILGSLQECEKKEIFEAMRSEGEDAISFIRKLLVQADCWFKRV